MLKRNASRQVWLLFSLFSSFGMLALNSAFADTSRPVEQNHGTFVNSLPGTPTSQAAGSALSALIQLPSRMASNSQQSRELLARTMTGTCVFESGAETSLPCPPMDFVISSLTGADVGACTVQSDGSFACVLPQPGQFKIRARSASYVITPNPSTVLSTGPQGEGAVLRVKRRN